jgi:xylan 1,4-beta-xylosidase
MLRHWNEVPHRMGLFGVGEEVRPQYFVYQMLSRLGEERIAAQADECVGAPPPDLRVLAARGERHVAALVVNCDLRASRDAVLTLQLSHLRPGRKRLTVYRIDAERRWSPEALELLPVERREIAVLGTFRCQIYSPADSVAMVTLADAP